MNSFMSSESTAAEIKHNVSIQVGEPAKILSAIIS